MISAAHHPCHTRASFLTGKRNLHVCIPQSYVRCRSGAVGYMFGAIWAEIPIHGVFTGQCAESRPLSAATDLQCLVGSMPVLMLSWLKLCARLQKTDVPVPVPCISEIGSRAQGENPHPSPFAIPPNSCPRRGGAVILATTQKAGVQARTAHTGGRPSWPPIFLLG